MCNMYWMLSTYQPYLQWFIFNSNPMKLVPSSLVYKWRNWVSEWLNICLNSNSWLVVSFIFIFLWIRLHALCSTKIVSFNLYSSPSGWHSCYPCFTGERIWGWKGWFSWRYAASITKQDRHDFITGIWIPECFYP